MLDRAAMLSLIFLFHCRAPGGPVAGAADGHCAGRVQATGPSACQSRARDAGDALDDYGETLYGNEGDDDDCKYHVTWTATDLYQGAGVYFTVTATDKATGQAIDAAAEPYAELELG